uniref:Uncharacterized protein n=1 Tax=Lygus hesperus TaxID=30085 RepID=A0A146MFT4_LYGHE
MLSGTTKGIENATNNGVGGGSGGFNARRSVHVSINDISSEIKTSSGGYPMAPHTGRKSWQAVSSRCRRTNTPTPHDREENSNQVAPSVGGVQLTDTTNNSGNDVYTREYEYECKDTICMGGGNEGNKQTEKQKTHYSSPTLPDHAPKVPSNDAQV